MLKALSSNPNTGKRRKEGKKEGRERERREGGREGREGGRARGEREGRRKGNKEIISWIPVRMK
jgi:flagellar biosynthesis/type III secretory pathway protein FliH